MSSPTASIQSVNIARWRLAIFLLFALPGLSFSTWVSRTPVIRDLLDVSTAQMGWIIFGLAAGSMIGLSFAGHVVARRGARFVIVTCGLLFTAGLGAVGIAATYTSVPAVFISLLFFGLGYGMAEVALNVEGAALERTTGKTLMPALHAGFSAGTLLGAGIGSGADALEITVLLHLSGMAVLITVIVVAFCRYLPSATGRDGEDGEDDIPMTMAERFAIWKERRLLLLGLIVLGMAFAEGSASDWLPIMMVDGYGVESAMGSSIYALFVGAMLVSRLSGGYFLDRFGRVPVLRATAVLAIIGLLLVIFGQHYLVAAVGVVFWGLGAALGFPVGMSAAADVKRGAAARVSAIATIGYLAFLAGPPFLGLLGEHFGLLRAMLVVLVFVVLSALLSQAAKPPAKRESA
ncbi:MFS transporter [Paenibacillus sp. 1P07SE]|uniref:MFS transporter n=1 Tax=Paenibacillus sp. 1P07SE TaxID=3132209 RepID=UPI0039A77A14